MEKPDVMRGDDAINSKPGRGEARFRSKTALSGSVSEASPAGAMRPVQESAKATIAASEEEPVSNPAHRCSSQG